MNEKLGLEKSSPIDFVKSLNNPKARITGYASVDSTLTKLRALTTSEDTPDATQDPEYLEGIKIGQGIIRKLAYGRKRTKKHRGAQKGAFGQVRKAPKIG